MKSNKFKTLTRKRRIVKKRREESTKKHFIRSGVKKSGLHKRRLKV